MKKFKFLKIYFFLAGLICCLFFINSSIAQTGTLGGRIIVIDPGHGGSLDSGAVGPSGLKESDLNFKVALFLKDLLEEKGARVILTRTFDTESIKGYKTDGEELKARAIISNDNNADLFISIHHNSVGSRSRYSANETQVYYKLADDGPSCDFAKILLKDLSKRMKSRTGLLSPANYAVLRHNTRPAILGEANYISNPSLEKLLKTAEFQKQEALGYYESVMEYFGKGVPSLDAMNFLTPFEDVPLIIHGIIKDPVSHVNEIQLYLDNQQVTTIHSDEFNLKIDAPLEAGKHSVLVKAKNSNGQSGIPFKYDFTISRPAVALDTQVIPSSVSEVSKGKIFIKTKVSDIYGYPIADDYPVYFLIGDKGYLSRTIKGYAYCYPQLEAVKDNLTIKTECGNISKEVVLNNKPASSFIAFVKSSKNSDNINDVKCVIDNSDTTYTNSDGVFGYDNLNSGEHTIEISITGYKPQKYKFKISSAQLLNQEIKLEPLYNGVLHKHKIMIDQLVSSNPKVTKANWDTAAILQKKLLAAGAEVIMARSGINENVKLLDKLKHSIKADPDIYYIINHEKTKYLSHYYTSKGGKKLAALTKKSLSGIKVIPSTSFLITHTPCPTLQISFGPVYYNANKEADILLKTSINYFKDGL